MKLPGLMPIAILMFTGILCVWLGIAGPIFADTTIQKVLTAIERWQTLLGVAGAFIVAWIAVRPVWKQVGFQSAQAALQLLPMVEKELAEYQSDLALIGAVDRLDEGFGYLSFAASSGMPHEMFFAEVGRIAKMIKEGVEEIPDAAMVEFAQRLRLEEKDRQLRHDYLAKVRQMRIAVIMLSATASASYEDDKRKEKLEREIYEASAITTESRSQIQALISQRMSKVRDRATAIEAAIKGAGSF